MKLDSKVSSGPIEHLWDQRRFEMKLVNPANKRKHTIIVVGSGLAGGVGAATLAELGYNVKCFCFQDSRAAPTASPRRAASTRPRITERRRQRLPAVLRHGEGRRFRSREANVYRLAEMSVNIIDQCVAQGVPFAREYGGLLANRSFGGAQVSRTFYARGQTGQQLLLGAYQALERQVAGRVTMHPRTRDAGPRGDQRPGSRHHHARPGQREDRVACRPTRWCSATGGYGNVYYLSTNAKGSQLHRYLARVQAGRRVRQSVLHADPSDLHSRIGRAPVEAHVDERVAAQ